MKFHANTQISPFDKLIDIDGKDWSYIVMGYRTFLRPPNLLGTYETDYDEVVGFMPPIGLCPPPEQDAIEDFIRTKVVSVYKDAQ